MTRMQRVPGMSRLAGDRLPSWHGWPGRLMSVSSSRPR